MNQFLNSSVNLNVTFNGSIALKTDVYGVSQEPHITAEESDLCQADSYPYQDYTQLQWVHALFILSYLLIIFLSVTGNLMVIWTICRNKHMRTVTNYYILNLAVSDFLVSVFVMPLKLLEYTAPCQWHIFNHRFLCSFLYYVLPIFVFASVLTLLAISIERLVRFQSENFQRYFIYKLVNTVLLKLRIEKYFLFKQTSYWNCYLQKTFITEISLDTHEYINKLYSVLCFPDNINRVTQKIM